MLKLVTMLGRLPKPVLYVLADFIYIALLNIVRYRRATIEKNLLIAFPEKTMGDRTQLMKDFYRHLSDVIVETLMLTHMHRDELLQSVTVIGKEHIEELARNNQSFLMFSAHQANWEWMVAAIAQNCPCPMDALYRPLHNAAMETYFKQTRTRFCSAMIPADNAPRTILKLRKSVRAFGMIADQTPRRRDDKFWIQFMGTPTAVFPGPDRIARITSYPVLFVATEKLGRGRYQCTISPLASPPYDAEGQVSELYMQAVEKQIRRQPALWLWSHRRWRYEPAADVIGAKDQEFTG